MEISDEGIRPGQDGLIKTKGWHSLKDNDHMTTEKIYMKEKYCATGNQLKITRYKHVKPATYVNILYIPEKPSPPPSPQQHLF